MNSSDVFNLLEQILLYFAQEDSSVLALAKEEYFLLTGKLIEEDGPFFENKMLIFNDWFIFDFLYKNQRPLTIYLQEQEVDPPLISLLLSVNYSLFYYQGKNWRGKMVVQDLLNNKKLLFPSKSSLLLVKGDIFIARIVGPPYLLLKGVITLPNSLYPLLKKKSSYISKDSKLKKNFLYKLEEKYTKFVNYKHLSPLQIFADI